MLHKRYRMRDVLLLFAIMPLVAACTMGVQGPKQVLIPEGEPVKIFLASDETREGELLAVTATELILKAHGRILAVGLPSVRKVVLTRYETTVTGEWVKVLTLYCRYPQGLSDEQWQRLLREAGQEEIERLGGT
jgi:hypothetical protein